MPEAAVNVFPVEKLIVGVDIVYPIGEWSVWIACDILICPSQHHRELAAEHADKMWV